MRQRLDSADIIDFDNAFATEPCPAVLVQDPVREDWNQQWPYDMHQRVGELVLMVDILADLPNRAIHLGQYPVRADLPIWIPNG